MGVEKITWGEEEYRMSFCHFDLDHQIGGKLIARTRLCPTIIASSSDRLDAFILNAERSNLVSRH